MMNEQNAADLPPVGVRFRQRRERLHMTQDEVATEAGVNRDTVSAIEKGAGSARKRREVEEALTRLEEAAGLRPIEEPEPEVEESEAKPDAIRLTFHNVYGIGEIIAEGPGDKPDELVAAVVKLLAEIRDKGAQ